MPHRYLAWDMNTSTIGKKSVYTIPQNPASWALLHTRIASAMMGPDPQLEKAVQVVIEELEKSLLAQPKRPPDPNYHPK